MKTPGPARPSPELIYTSLDASRGSGTLNVRQARVRVLVAPDAFKGTFTAEQAADAIALGVEDAGLAARTCPLADGGEGTMATIRRVLGGTVMTAGVRDPLGRPTESPFLLIGEGSTAVLDCAAASGLALVQARERDPVAASTAGTGDLIAAAVRAGARRVLVAAGGSATTDGGRGAIEAIQRAGGLGGARLTVLCDVGTPFEDAARVFAPQKGATPAQVGLLAARMDEFAADLPRDPRGRPMSGCAGGLSGGLWAMFDAQLVSGSATVFELVGLDAEVARASAVISGEGALDEQSLTGKVVGSVARLCARHGVALHVLTGRDQLDAHAAHEAGIASIRIARDEHELRDGGREIARRVADPAG